MLLVLARFGLGDAPAFLRLLDLELAELPKRSLVEIGSLHSLGSKEGFLKSAHHTAFKAALESKAQSSTLYAELQALGTEEILAKCHSFFPHGVWTPAFQATFEAVVLGRLTSTGRASATTLMSAAFLTEIAARVKSSSGQFRKIVAERADEHLRSALDDGGAAIIPLMFFLVAISEEKLQHVHQILDAFMSTVTAPLPNSQAAMLMALSYASSHLSRDRLLSTLTTTESKEDKPLSDSTKVSKLILSQEGAQVANYPDALGLIDFLFGGVHQVLVLQDGSSPPPSEIYGLEELIARVIRIGAPHIEATMLRVPTSLSEVESARALRDLLLPPLFPEHNRGDAAGPQVVEFE